jgi:hypothetical protein
MLNTVTTILIVTGLMLAAPAFAVDGQVLINQSTVMAAGGFPYKITQPGSYKLSGNLLVPANVDGIDILTNNVTIDLNGFTINGPVTCTGAGSGISCVSPAVSTLGVGASGVNDVTIRNGSVVGFQTGISSQRTTSADGSNILVEEIHASGNSQVGIWATGAVVRRNTASLNAFVGIIALNSTVTENVANSNRVFGLNIEYGVYGGNTFDGNGVMPVSNTLAVSQNNNGCNGVAC